MMQKTQLDKNLYEYQFPPQEGHPYGYNLYTLTSRQQQVLLIDSAFPEQATQLLVDLQASGFVLDQVLISHFHEDHIMGLTVLPKIPVVGSEYWRQSLLEQQATPEELALFRATKMLHAGDYLTFGDFQLSFLKAPGHSKCSLFVVIDDRFVHVGDNLMATNDGRPILPYATLNTIPDHIRSLERLCEFKNYTLLLSHGQRLSGAENILSEIEDRLQYLRAVVSSGGKISFEQATAGCQRKFIGRSWHQRMFFAPVDD